MATASARELQKLPIITNAASPEVDTDEVAKLLALFDHALDHHRAIAAMCASVPGARRDYAGLVTIRATESPYAEYAAQLWASAKQCTYNEQVHEYAAGVVDAKPATIRAIRVSVDGCELFRIAFPAQVVVTHAAVLEALRKPHWSEDATLTPDEIAERERMEAGHA